MSAAAAIATKPVRSLLFGLGEAYYRVELTRVREVLPWVALEAVDAGDPRGLIGWLRLRGERLPVVDLNEVVHGEASPRVLGSRILLMECRSRGAMKLIGAVATHVFAMALEQNSEFAERFDPCDVLGSILAGIA